MDNNTPWLTIEPISAPEDFARYILREYIRISHGHVPSEQKLVEMVFFCFRDALQVLGRPVMDATFSIEKGCIVHMAPALPPIEKLANIAPNLADYDAADIFGSVLPNYAVQESWALREEIKMLCRQVCGTVSETMSHTLSMEEIWENGENNPPYDYYTGEPLIPEE